MQWKLARPPPMNGVGGSRLVRKTLKTRMPTMTLNQDADEFDLVCRQQQLSWTAQRVRAAT